MRPGYYGMHATLIRAQSTVFPRRAFCTGPGAMPIIYSQLLMLHHGRVLCPITYISQCYHDLAWFRLYLVCTLLYCIACIRSAPEAWPFFHHHAFLYTTSALVSVYVTLNGSNSLSNSYESYRIIGWEYFHQTPWIKKKRVEELSSVITPKVRICAFNATLD